MLDQDKVLVRGKEDPLLSALVGETVTYSSALATVTRNCVVVRDSMRNAKMVVSIESLTGLRKTYTTLPALMVISCGLLTIAAAAYASKQGLETTLPIAALGILFLLAYLGTRRAAVVFVVKEENVESVRGTYRDATALIKAVERMRASAKRAS